MPYINFTLTLPFGLVAIGVVVGIIAFVRSILP
jgi:hypothetical protein